MIRSISALAGLFIIATVFADTSAPVGMVPEPVVDTRAVFVSAQVPIVSALSYVVVDMATGAVIASEAPTVVRPIASVTKLATAEVLLHDEAALQQSVTVTAADVATEGRAGSLVAGEVYTTRELLFPLLLESSNDAAVALTHVPDTVLLDSMQKRLREFGIIVSDTSGLSDYNQASADALARYLTEVFVTTPHLFDITRLTQYVGTEKGWRNNSPVAALPGYRGGKHGYTEAAQRTLVAVFDEEISGETRSVGYVLLGSADLRLDIGTLRDFVTAAVSYE